MKKLFLLSAFLILGCSGDESNQNNNISDSEISYFFELEVFGVVNRVEGIANLTTLPMGQSPNSCFTIYGAETYVWLSIADITNNDFVTGEYFTFQLSIEEPQVGNSNVGIGFNLTGGFMHDAMNNATGTSNSEIVGLFFREIPGDWFENSHLNQMMTDIQITDLGQSGSRTFKATYEKTVYFATLGEGGSGLNASIPTTLRIEMNLLRQ